MADRNLFLDLHFFDTANIQAFENVLTFIQNTNPQANINEIVYTTNIGARRIQEKLVSNIVAVDAQSLAEKMLAQLERFELENLKTLFNLVKLDLSTPKISYLYDFIEQQPLSTEEIRALNRKTFSQKEIEAWHSRLSLRAQSMSWVGLGIFNSTLAMSTHHNEKVKFLILEIKKAFQNKPQEFEEFKQLVFKEKHAFFTSAFSVKNFELLDFLMEELDFDINQSFNGAPLFFKASDEASIQYILDNGADFKEAKNEEGKTYAERWGKEQNGRAILTLLSAKSASSVNLGEFYIDLLKNQKTVADIKDVMNKIAKKEKVKNKTLLKIEGQSPLYHAIKHQHWKFTKSVYETFAENEDFKKNLYNELDTATQSVPVLLHILANKDNGYDSADKGGSRRKMLLCDAFTHTDFKKLKSSNDFMKLFTNYSAKAMFNYLGAQDLNSDFHASLRAMGLRKNEEFFNKIKNDKTYGTNSGHYNSVKYALNNLAVRADFLSYIIDDINLSPKDLINIISLNFINSKKEKMFANTDSSLLFFLEIAQRTFSVEDKSQLVDKYINHLQTFVQEHHSAIDKAIKENPSYPPSIRFNSYNFNFLPAQKLLEAFCHYEGYHLNSKQVKVVKSFLDIMPVENQKTKPEIEDMVVATLEKRLVEDSLKTLLPNSPSQPSSSAKKTNKI